MFNDFFGSRQSDRRRAFYFHSLYGYLLPLWTLTSSVRAELRARIWLHFSIKGSKLTHASFLHIQNEHSFDLHMASVSMSVPDVSTLMFVLFVLRACFVQAHLQVRQP
jgi:hypothetical protein